MGKRMQAWSDLVEKKGADVAAHEAYEEGATSENGATQALTRLVGLIEAIEDDAGADFMRRAIDALEQKVISGVRDEVKSYTQPKQAGLKGFFQALVEGEGNAGKIHALHRLSQHIACVKGEEVDPLVSAVVRQIAALSFNERHKSLPALKNALVNACAEVPAPPEAAAVAPQPHRSRFRRRHHAAPDA